MTTTLRRATTRLARKNAKTERSNPPIPMEAEAVLSVKEITGEKELMTAKEILMEWAREKGITPARFTALTGYTYPHSWGLLSGKREPTTDTLGRLVKAGYASVAERIAKAMTDQAAQ